MGFVAVIEVGGVVSNLVGQVDQLGLKRRPLIEQILSQFGKLAGGVVVRVLDDAFPHFKRQVQAAKTSIAHLKILDDTQRVQVVIEEGSMLSHSCVQSFFAGMAKGRMSNVVHQGQGLHQIHVQVELGRDSACDLRDFDGMSEAIAKVIGESARENLRLGLKPAKGAGMNNAVPVALEVIPIGMLGFRNSASAGLLDPHGVVGQHDGSLAFSQEASLRSAVCSQTSC